jgi:hypothetical protein
MANWGKVNNVRIWDMGIQYRTFCLTIPMDGCRCNPVEGLKPEEITPLVCWSITGQWFYIAHGLQGAHVSMTTGSGTQAGTAHGVAHGLYAVGTRLTVAIFLPQ